MDDQNKQDFLSKTIDEKIKLFDRKRQKNKFFAFFIKLFGAALAASVTILLGIEYEGKPDDIFKNITIILGALITILNTWDAFFNHKMLWVRFTETTVELRVLQDKLNYLISSSKQEVSEKELDAIFEEMNVIVEETANDWKSHRSKEKTRQ